MKIKKKKKRNKKNIKIKIKMKMSVTDLTCWKRSVNSKSFIFGSDFVYFRWENINSDPNMKLLLYTEHTNYHY